VALLRPTGSSVISALPPAGMLGLDAVAFSAGRRAVAQPPALVLQMRGIQVLPPTKTWAGRQPVVLQLR
jgi:hypothetical protein